MNKLIYLLFAACAFFTHVNAQEHLPPNFFMTKLSNGLDILVIEDNSVPLATIEIAVHNGSFTEDSAYNGLSHLYEHMFFKANKDIPSQEAYLKRVKELGISFNGTTGTERVNYFFTLPVANLHDGLTFMNSAIRYPLFLSEEMKKEDPVVDGEFQRNESNPGFLLFQDFNAKMWGPLYVRKNPIGIHEVILTATPEKMHAIQQKYYWPNNSILVVGGDVKHEDVFNDVKSIYGDWQSAGFDPIQKWPIPEFTKLTTNRDFITINENARVPIVAQGWFGPDTRTDIKSTYAADVFSFILSQTASRFQQQLIDSGLALQVQFGYQTQKYVGPIQLFMVPNPTRVKDCLKKLEEEINLWDSDDYFTDEQIETAKNQLAIQETYNSEKTSTYVHSITLWWSTATIDYYTTYIDNLKKVNRQDIQQFVRTYIKGKPKVSGILLSTQMQKNLGIDSYNQLLQ
jgi:zinc protease